MIVLELVNVAVSLAAALAFLAWNGYGVWLLLVAVARRVRALLPAAVRARLSPPVAREPVGEVVTEPAGAAL